MTVKIIEGNIFNSECQTIVNTVNCFGVMGKGIALTYRYLMPEMYLKYKKMCDDKILQTGKLWLYKHRQDKWVLNFPTKYHWKFPSKIEYIETGLQKFVSTYEEKQIKSIAFPMLGTTNGGLNEQLVLEVMLNYLETCAIEIEIYNFVQTSPDRLLADFKALFFAQDLNDIARLWQVSSSSVKRINEVLKNDNINSIIELSNINGVGEKTIQKLFNQIHF